VQPSSLFHRPRANRPEPRQLLHIGVNQSLHDDGPQSTTSFYIGTRPIFSFHNQVLRLVVAPTYLDGELGFKISSENTVARWRIRRRISKQLREVRRGNYFRDESSRTCGGANVSVYHLFNPAAADSARQRVLIVQQRFQSEPRRRRATAAIGNRCHVTRYALGGRKPIARASFLKSDSHDCSALMPTADGCSSIEQLIDANVFPPPCPSKDYREIIPSADFVVCLKSPQCEADRFLRERFLKPSSPSR